MPGAALAAGQAIARLGRRDSGRPHAIAPTTLRSFTASATFDCHWQCTECGFQVPAPISDIDANIYRTPADDRPQDRRPTHACGSCGSRGTWANLREGAVVEALIVQDDVRQTTSGARTKGLIRLIGTGIWATLSALVCVSVPEPTLVMLAVSSTALMLHSAHAEFRLGRRARQANAWNHQRRPRGRVRSRHTGELTATGLLRAPLSGRPCVAYELGVRHDGDASAEPWTWTLLEQRNLTTLAIGDTKLSARPWLELDRQRHEQALGARARDELRKRGLDPECRGYTLFESIIEPGATVTLREHGNVAVLSTR